MPFVTTTGLIIYGALALDAASGGLLKETGKVVYRKAVGAAFSAGVKKFGELLKDKDTGLPSNLDLQKAMRKAMLDATGMVGAAMMEQGKERDFAEKLQAWVKAQSKPTALEAIDTWANWEQAAEANTELLFTTQKEHKQKKEALVQQMSHDWMRYVSFQLGYGVEPTEIGQQALATVPADFSIYMLTGFTHKGKALRWADAVMVTFTELLRDEKHELGKRANAAFTQNFLADIKVQVSDVKADTSEILRLVRDSFPSYVAILELHAETLHSQQELLTIQHKTIDELRAELAQLRVEKETINQLLFDAVTEKTLAVGQVTLLKEQRDELDRKYEALIRENETLKREEIAKRKEPIDHLKEEGKDDDLLAQAAQLMEEGRFMEARELQIRSAQQLKALSKESSKRAAHQYHELAMLDQGELRYTDALLHFREAVELQPEEPRYLNALGLFLITMALYDEAITHLEKALRLLEATDDHQRWKGAVLNNIGSAWRSKGEYDMSIAYYEQALAVGCKVFGKEHSIVATSLNNLGVSWNAKGEYDRAIDYYEQALAIDRKIFGEEHSSVASCLNNLGLSWKAKGEYDRAIDYHEQALSIGRKVFGEEHPTVATYLNNLGNVWPSKGEYDRAIDYHEQALTIGRKVFGEEHPTVAAYLNNLGNVWTSKGEYDSAIAFFEQALDIDRKVFGEEHPTVAIRLNNLGLSWCSKGEYDRAIAYHERALTINRKVFGEEHPDAAFYLGNLGATYLMKKEFTSAVPYLEHALRIRVKFLGEGHPDTLTINEWLAATHRRLASQTSPPNT